MRHEIDVDQLADRLAAGATVVDVREPAEYAAAHVAETRLVPMGQLAGRLHELDRRRPVHLICRTGNRSTQMQQALAEAGFTRVYNIKEGMVGSSAGPGWIKRGLPVEACPTC
jgi:rhodanese-related sulfurtransferase